MERSDSATAGRESGATEIYIYCHNAPYGSEYKFIFQVIVSLKMIMIPPKFLFGQNGHIPLLLLFIHPNYIPGIIPGDNRVNQ